MSAVLRRKIFVGCRELGLNTETRRDLQLVATGKESLSDMTEAEMQKVFDALIKRGFKPTSKRSGKYQRPKAKRPDLRYVHVLWKLLGDAGHLDRPGRDGLNAFIRSRFEKSWGAVPLDVDDLGDWTQIDQVIQALTSMCARKGVAIDRSQQRR